MQRADPNICANKMHKSLTKIYARNELTHRCYVDLIIKSNKFYENIDKKNSKCYNEFAEIKLCVFHV